MPRVDECVDVIGQGMEQCGLGPVKREAESSLINLAENFDRDIAVKNYQPAQPAPAPTLTPSF